MESDYWAKNQNQSLKAFNQHTNVFCSAMITFMKKNNLEELIRLCNVFDLAQAESFGLGLQQPECIGRNDLKCTYIFTKKSADTVLPSSITEILKTPVTS